MTNSVDLRALSVEELEVLEIGKNQCAASTTV